MHLTILQEFRSSSPLKQVVIVCTVLGVLLALVFGAVPHIGELQRTLTSDERAQLQEMYQLSEEQTDAVLVALRSIKEGANFAEAKAALLMGETEKAVGILKQIVKNSRTNRQRASTEEAKALRNLAAITRLEDPAEAIGYYQESTKLEPADIRSWIALGDVAVAAGDLNVASDAFRTASELAERGPSDNDDWGQDVMLQFSYSHRSRVAIKQGQLAEAEQFLLRAKEVALRRREALRTNNAAANLVIGIRELGDLYYSQAKFTQAVQVHKESVELIEALAAAEPHNTVFQRELAVSLSLLAQSHNAFQRYAEAEPLFKRALDIFHQLRHRNPDNVDMLRDYAVLTNKFGDMKREQGGNEPAALIEAENLYRSGLDEVVRLAGHYPHNPLLQRDMAVTLEKLSDVYMARQEPEEALALLQQARSIQENIAITNTKDVEVDRALSAISCREGDALALQRKFDSADRKFLECIEIRQSLADIESGGVQAKLMLALAHVSHSCSQLGQRRVSEAFRSLEIAAIIVREVRKPDSVPSELRLDPPMSEIAKCWNCCGDVSINQDGSWAVKLPATADR